MNEPYKDGLKLLCSIILGTGTVALLLTVFHVSYINCLSVVIIR